MTCAFGLVAAGASVAGSVTQGGSRPAANGAIPAPVSSEAVIATAAGMAVPLFKPQLHGTDGGQTRVSVGFNDINTAHGATVSGTINGQTFRVVPSGEIGVTDRTTTVAGDTSSVYAVFGRSYRYVRLHSAVSRAVPLQTALLDGGEETWTVASDVYAYGPCTQHGATRVPSIDCGKGVQRHTAGHVTVTPLTGDRYRVSIPIGYLTRNVDAKGRPLTTLSRSTGHWTLTGVHAYNGWLWTVEWNINSVAYARIAGSAHASGIATVLTDGPFH